MKTNELLETATGMGFSCEIKNDLVVINLEYSTKLFNPTIGDLILWLMDRGDLNLYGKIEGSFFNGIDEYLGFCSHSEKSLKENLLNIVLQIIKAEKEE